jgi:outer membrane protein assembly factor BamB
MSMEYKSIATAVALTLGTSSFASAQTHFSVAYQVDAAHSGTLRFGTGFKPPLTLKWTRDLGLDVSYPIVARGNVYVTTGCPGSDYTGQVVDLDLATGNTVWHKDYDVLYCRMNAAYDNGHLFVLGYDTMLRKFSRSGELLWSTKLDDIYSSAMPPAAFGGQVFATLTENAILAVSERDGSRQWLVGDWGDEGFPLVGDGGVYVTVPFNTAKFDLLTGKVLWHYTCGGEGGGGWATAYNLGRVYSLDGDCNAPILNSQTGNINGHLFSLQPPAFWTDKTGETFTIVLGQDELISRNKLGGRVWTFSKKYLASAPLVINNVVAIASFDQVHGSNLYIVDAATGQELWETVLPGYYYENTAGPMIGLGGGYGVLLVPTGTKLSAFVEAAPGNE